MFNNNLNEPSDDKQTAIEHEYIILYYIIYKQDIWIEPMQLKNSRNSTIAIPNMLCPCRQVQRQAEVLSR